MLDNDEEIISLNNIYVSSGVKGISKDINKLNKISARKLIIQRDVIIKAKLIYNLSYVEHIIKLGRYFSKELNGFELSNEKENIYLENIRHLEEINFGPENSVIGSEYSEMEQIVNTITSIYELEELLVQKGVIQKKPVTKLITNRIARKDGDSI